MNVGDPPNKTYTSYPVHKMVYIKAIVSKCKKGEISPDKSVNIIYLNRYANVFGISPCIVFNKYFDMAIATPLMSSKEDFEGEMLEKGNLVIPLSRDGETASVFYPGGFEDME